MILNKTLKTLEYSKILKQVAAHCSFSAGIDLVMELHPTTDLEEARIWQTETAEALGMLEDNAPYNLGGARDVRSIAINAVRGVVIEPGGLLDIRYTLRRGQTLKRNLHKRQHEYPLLAELADEMEDCQALQDAIETAINDNGEVKDTASARLAIIRRDLKIAFDRLQSRLNSIVQSSRNQPYLQEQMVTMRNGRYVIPLIADHKGKIKGIVHDSSSSGATLFIEPLETVELNNKWRELQIDEEKEVRRILAQLTDLVGEENENIVRTVEVLAYLDMTMAKALYAQKSRAVQPKLVAFSDKKGTPDHPGSTIVLRGARHPMLTDHVVPIDVEFGDNTWILVVTGPNTGGKTVALKTVGLHTLMAQSGLHLPADEATLSVFEGIFADIGDEQSIEQSLSTFSSHMTNIIDILKSCDDRSLVILDELGAGTDPAEGSALARALLNRLRAQQVTTMVSTHHPELKIYAVETPGVRNASVEFNLETLAPTYRLIIGLPGRSNALAIASRLGLDDDIIESARGLVATEDLVADDLLDEIQRTRKETIDNHEIIAALRAELEEERDVLQARLDKIEDERRDVIRAARRNAEDELNNFRKELKRLTGDMRLAGLPLEKLRDLQDAADRLDNVVNAPLDDDEVEQVSTSVDWKPKLGDTVFLDTLNAEGSIVEMDDKEALVQVGALKVRAKYSDMRKRTRSERRTTERGHAKQYAPARTAVPEVKSPGIELDLRGQRVEEAIEALDRYIDAAYTSGLPFGRIIHGKGTGRLRQAVQEFLNQHPLISKVTTAHPNEGGSGVTIVHMSSLS